MLSSAFNGAALNGRKRSRASPMAADDVWTWQDHVWNVVEMHADDAWALEVNGQAGKLAAITASDTWTYSASATAVNIKPLPETADIWAWDTAAALANTGGLSGSDTWTVSQSADITRVRPLSASDTWTWQDAADMRNIKPISAADSWSLSQTASISSVKAMTATDTWAWTSSGLIDVNPFANDIPAHLFMRPAQTRDFSR